MTVDADDWQGLDTGTVSDALDQAGIAGQLPAITPLDRSFRIAGPAFTVRYGPVGQDGGTVGDYIDDVPEDAVVVLDNQGRTDVTVWGDLLTLTAHRREVGGTVIDGICRDSDLALDLRYPVYARGSWMRTGKDRVRVDKIQGPVGCAGVRIEPGDLVFGDGDGVVAVPVGRVAEVLDRARAIAAAEESIRRRVEDGETLRAARAAVGYHRLQTRR